MADKVSCCGCFNTINPPTKEEQCHCSSQFYQGRFPDIPPFLSRELLELPIHPPRVVLVDVRTLPERQVSMLEGAISLAEFDQMAVPTLERHPDARVVTYCTIGYRSGLEARRLRDLYPSLLEGRIYSLDGIVAYTHAVAQLEQDEDKAAKAAATDGDEEETQQVSTQPTNPLATITATRRLRLQTLHPDTQQPTDTRRLHTFGSMWDCANEKFDTTHYSPAMLGVRSIQVGIRAVVRTTQRMTHKCRQCACQ
jgi:rhodanese-related sulfurtransferase